MKKKQFIGPLLAASLFLLPGVLLAASPSDLLEQGVYSEETKGDLNGALQLYQQVIAQSKADQAVAAEAQYHLGACYYKMHDFTNASAAFQTVIDAYPDQTNLVSRARQYLAGVTIPLQPVPWADGEALHLDLRLETGVKIGFVEYSAVSGLTNNEKIWRLSSTIETLIASHESISHVEIYASNFKPLHSIWNDTLLGRVETSYYPDHADLKNLINGEIKSLSFQGSVIDNEETVEWMRCLPLADGYTNSQQILASLGYHIVPINFHVTGPETVQVPAGTYQCFKLEMNIGQTFWYSSDPSHYLVKFEAGGAVAELTAITNRTTGDTVNYTDSGGGFSLVAPSGWVFDKEESDDANKTVVSIVDPDAVGFNTVTTEPLSSLGTNETGNLHAYASAKIKAVSKMYKDFKLRGDGITDVAVGGSPAAAAVYDYVTGKQKTTGYSLWMLGSTKAVYFQSLMPSDQFATYQPKIAAVFSSFQTK